MMFLSKKEYKTYLIGDFFFFVFSLWLALFLRHLSWPSWQFFLEHLLPFSILFLLSFLVFQAIGLYDKQISRKKIPATIINAQIVNGIIGVFFFYFLPYFGITPKTNLFLYLLISSLLIVWWRLLSINVFSFRAKQKVVIVVSGPELKEIAQELKENKKYNVQEVFESDLNSSSQEKIKEKISQGFSLVIADFDNPEVDQIMSQLYGLLFSGIVFIDAQKFYEEIFDRVPLSLIKENWLLKNLYLEKTSYDFVKRIVDFIIALPLLLVSSVFLPLIALTIKIDSQGPVFVIQPRIGQGGLIIQVMKLRSMKKSDQGVWVEEDDQRITRVGRFLRKTRIDELPQLWNVIKGDLSLIGPRPDIVGLRDKLEKEIPYYRIRDLVRPGLSGWAQIKQENPPQSVKATRERLMYDFYYIKNRNLVLDFKIALRTLRILASRAGV
jgi:exopolysaccharide biosynthesis polyprenyl glycosylphosphotransferase